HQCTDFRAAISGFTQAEISRPTIYGESTRRDRAFHRIAVPLAIAAPALVREVQPFRGPSANQPSFPAYERAPTSWLPSNPISKAFFSIQALALGAWVSIPASANACSSRRDPFQCLRLQLWLGYSDIKHTARYSELSARPFPRLLALKMPQLMFRGKTSARSISPRLLMNSTMASVSSLSTLSP